jgi:hypothetical protein
MQNSVVVGLHEILEKPSSKTKAIKIFEEIELQGVHCRGLG